jgi:hypothetical protein
MAGSAWLLWSGRAVLRHDSKKKDVDSVSHSNELIRGIG